MLEPQHRQLLFDALEPPVGYKFDQGIGTTFTLDLLALMMAPVAFTFFDQKRTEEGLAAASLEVLEGLRRYADRLTIFCQIGRISVPPGRFPQLAFLEQSVVQCRPPEGGSFHPKLWVLRFTGDGPVKYRVLCMSRNLMFCRAWDTMLTLDGEVKGGVVAANRRLIEFVQHLPSLGADSTAAVKDRVQLFATELLTAKFELPDGVTSLQFWPMGISQRRTDPFKDMGKRLLVVSPFVGVTALEHLAAKTSECVVVSTLPQLAGLSSRPDGVSRYFVLNEKAVAEDEDTGAALSESMADAIAQADLHAKLYVTEIGAEAHVWTGSLNATDAGLNRNVEFMVELIGHRKHLGIDTLMNAEKNEVRLVNLIREVTNENVVASGGAETALEKLEQRLGTCRRLLVDAHLEAHVSPAPDQAYSVSLRSGENGLHLDDDVVARCWPVTAEALVTAFSIGAPGEELLAFPLVSLEGVTSFFAFELSAVVPEGKRRLAFVLNLPLHGAPANRRDNVLRTFLSDRGRFLKFMMLLLADEGFDPDGMRDILRQDGNRDSGGGNASASGLLEMLLNALDSAPVKLDHLESLIAQVTTDESGRSLLPIGFDEIWQPIRRRRVQMRAEQAVS